MKEQQQQQTTTTATATVTFHNKIKVIEIPGLSYYTDEEYDAIWYNDEEYEQIAENRKRCYQRGQSLENDETLSKEEKQMSELGTATVEESQERKERIYEARIAVFREQQLQWDEQIVDDELLADVYYDCTIESSLMAYSRATKLHQEELFEQRQQQQVMEVVVVRDVQPTKPKRRSSSSSSRCNNNSKRSNSNSSCKKSSSTVVTVLSPKKKNNKKNNNTSSKYCSVKQLGGGGSVRSREVFVA